MILIMNLCVLRLLHYYIAAAVLHVDLYMTMPSDMKVIIIVVVIDTPLRGLYIESYSRSRAAFCPITDGRAACSRTGDGTCIICIPPGTEFRCLAIVWNLNCSTLQV